MKNTLSQVIADKLRSCRAAYDSIPFHNKPVATPKEFPTLDFQLANIPTPASILLQPDELAHLVPPKEPKVIFVGAREPDTLTFYRHLIRHK